MFQTVHQMIRLEKEKETLLIPLYGKALESRKKSALLFDEKALEIVQTIDYDFSSLKIPGKTHMMLCLRAKLMDNFTGRFLERTSNPVVIHLGCGLDSRYHRLANPQVLWFDVDYQEVIDIKRAFFNETEKYHLVASSVTESQWIEKIPKGAENYLVIAEGLFMYLWEEEIKRTLQIIKRRTGTFTLIFDAFSIYASGKVQHHPSIRKTSANIRWGIRHSAELTAWDADCQLLEEIYFTSNTEIRKMDICTRLIFQLAHLFPKAREAHRILVYRICQPEIN